MNKHPPPWDAGRQRFLMFLIGLLAVLLPPLSAHADIDGHGPDAWRVVGVAENDVLNARMGPGADYPVIETFAHDARSLKQITCVPYYTPAHYFKLSEAEHEALPARWCLMQTADLGKAGWVAQRYLKPDYTASAPIANTSESATPGSDALIMRARDLVRTLYEWAEQAPAGGRHPLDPAHAGQFFSVGVVEAMKARPPGASPLYGAQDFDGSVSDPFPDPEQPMLRGMITLHVDIVNFGQPRRVTFRLRADPARPGAPLRVFRIEHEDWAFPETSSN
ncbi:MAG: hypothetical protein H2040_03035 [Euryhalocaulis sp.]|uniref:hypothetical protein n=1 Tax=Euryhalocaulis sp. TaxID=2744307 RepID=UPI0017B587A4|nr:hypothetical protein [Euryhalocaulis sp.]MBA4800815.1 hypothetical protein [Euryhalocaulis sp.]